MDEKFFSVVKNNPELWNSFPQLLNWIFFYSLHLIDKTILVVKMRFEHPTACEILRSRPILEQLILCSSDKDLLVNMFAYKDMHTKICTDVMIRNQKAWL